MAISRGLSTIAMSVSSSNDSHFGRPRSISRTDSLSSSDSRSSQPRGMPIHSRRPLYAPPPPLPPPQAIEGLDKGLDLAFELANNEYRNTSGLPPIPEGSSLRGGGSYTRPGQSRNYKHSMEIDNDNEDNTERRTSSSSNMPQPTHSAGGAGAHTSKITRRAPSPSNSNPMLQGEFPLAQESHDRSNRDYDHAMLSKIGKPNSPPRHPRAESSDSPVLAQKLSLQTKDVKPQKSSANEPTSAAGSVAPWITSPSSTGVSPAPRYGWLDQSGLRSPPLDSGTSALVLDPELFVLTRSTTHHHSTNGTAQVHDDTPNRSARNSCDQAMFTCVESEAAEDSALHGLNIEGGQNSLRRTSGTGLKRKALSPPGDYRSEERVRQDLHPLRMRVASKSPNTSYPSNHGSISSAASSVQPPSYSSSSSVPFSASSVPFSAAPSSITSMSSFDPNSPREQPSYMTSTYSVASPGPSLIARKGQEKLAPRKVSVQTTAMSPRPIATRIGNNYICACCPKKPKKFETEEQLRAHENEKQYSCDFCHNRFKNKNEAERHQNSLHLRNHSWSCAALAKYEAAFSPSGAVDSSSIATDACGYCGEEFSNHPAPDWDRRLEHLTSVHKYGECNSAKKFYRADHFRQHLKHSHAGRSGKWTNILEHACVRDEIPPEPTGFSGSAGDRNPMIPAQTTTGLSGPSLLPVGISTFHGSHDDGA